MILKEDHIVRVERITLPDGRLAVRKFSQHGLADEFSLLHQWKNVESVVNVIDYDAEKDILITEWIEGEEAADYEEIIVALQELHRHQPQQDYLAKCHELDERSILTVTDITRSFARIDEQ